MTTLDPKTKRSAIGTKFVYFLAGVTLILLMLTSVEFVSRSFFDRLAPKEGRAVLAWLLNQHVNPEKTGPLNIPHPYMLYTNRPGYEDEHFRQINSLGLRGQEIVPEKPEKVIRILCMGGSTTLGWPNIPDPSRTWVAVLQQYLHEKTGIEVQTLNAGLSYATSAELLAHYCYRYRYLNPDIVIIHTGGNDAVPLFYQNYHPEYTHFRPGWTSSPMLRPGEAFLLKSYFFRCIYAFWLSGVSLPSFLGETNWRVIDATQAERNVLANHPLGACRVSPRN